MVSHSCAHDGTVVEYGGAEFARMSGNDEDRMVKHWLARPDGTRVSSLGALPAPAYYGTIARKPSVVAIGDDVLVANARKYELYLRTRGGRVKFITRLTGPATRITDDYWRALTAMAVPRNSSPENRARVENMMGPTPRGNFPAFSAVLADPIGRFWVQDFQNPSAWTVFDAGGLLLGRLDLNPSGNMTKWRALVGVGADYVVVQEIDEDGFIHLRFYRASRSQR
jgi:hypothetical protein